jgi:hypothetical protein
MLAMALLALAPCSAATEYSSRPFSATVIDKETGRPIEGAVALAVWGLSYYTGHRSGPLNVTEAVTGENGVFHMAGWGPLPVPPGEREVLAILEPGQPGIYIFKAGYGLYMERLYPDGRLEDQPYFGKPSWTGDLVRTAWLDGKTLSLTRAADDVYARLSGHQTLMWLMLNCYWARNPRMTAALINESNRLQAPLPKIIYPNAWSGFDRLPAYECGSPREVLGPYIR